MITVLDTSICTTNAGDHIIMDSVNRVLRNLFSEAVFNSLPTHDVISKPSYKLINESKWCFVGGTNLLSSNMNKYNQWKINIYDALFLKNIVLMGVGWWQYQGHPNIYTKYLYKKVLSKNAIHSVRDSFTENMLKSIGITNVFNTGCPTIWGLDKDHCISIPRDKAENVVFTITDYKKDHRSDQKLIETLSNSYNDLYFWPQGSLDTSYLHDLCNTNNIFVLPPTLEAYDNLLKDKAMDIDFVGTRLHAGIRAMQFKRRSVIIAVDNRATEMGADFNIPVISRSEIDKIDTMLNSSWETAIKLPYENIDNWKKQFSSNNDYYSTVASKKHFI